MCLVISRSGISRYGYINFIKETNTNCADSLVSSRLSKSTFGIIVFTLYVNSVFPVENEAEVVVSTARDVLVLGSVVLLTVSSVTVAIEDEVTGSTVVVTVEVFKSMVEKFVVAMSVVVAVVLVVVDVVMVVVVPVAVVVGIVFVVVVDVVLAVVDMVDVVLVVKDVGLVRDPSSPVSAVTGGAKSVGAHQGNNLQFSFLFF